VKDLARLLKVYHDKSKFLSPDTRPWTRIRVQWEFMKRRGYAVWPLYGHVLQAFKEGRLELGPEVTMLAGTWLSLPGDARIKIGRNVYINGNVMLHSYELIEIGDFSGIGRGSIVTDGTHNDPNLPYLESGMRLKGPVIIGRHVMVFNNVAIMGGVTIGDRAMVATNSVVTKDVEPYTLVGGVPAKVIRRLDPIIGDDLTPADPATPAS
jgi:acetyltransferase-like isoleucine patch superfamily enzyme